MTVKPEGQKCQQYFSAMIGKYKRFNYSCEIYRFCHLWNVILFRFAASIGALQIGCALAWTSPSLPLLKSPDFVTPFKITSVDEVAQISAWTPIGAILGALSTGIFTGWMGRKTIFIVFSIPWICTWILTNMANSVVVLYVARFFCGLMLGLFSAVLPAYVSEIAEDSIRGWLRILYCKRFRSKNFINRCFIRRYFGNSIPNIPDSGYSGGLRAGIIQLV